MLEQGDVRNFNNITEGKRHLEVTASNDRKNKNLKDSTRFGNAILIEVFATVG